MDAVVVGETTHRRKPEEGDGKQGHQSREPVRHVNETIMTRGWL